MRPAGDAARKFGKYTLVAKLATGGMAEIFLARLQGAGGFEKLVCLKRILPALVKDPQFVQMFLSEAKVAAQSSHPNVCQVFELGEIDGSYFIAMEYLEGVALSRFRRREHYPHAIDPRLVVGLVAQTCEGLHDAHELTRPDGTSLGVVHRDVSGNNLFVTAAGVAKVLDFGIAKVHDASVRTLTGSLKGTLAYMAPEQLRGGAVDRRTDVFALGIVLWELFGRRYLFRRDTDFLTFEAIAQEPIPDVREVRPDVPSALAGAIARALARDPDQRFATARELGEALVAAVPPLSASAISAEIERAFAPALREQRALIKLAREGGSVELDSDIAPSIAPDDGTDPQPKSDTRATTPARLPSAPPATARRGRGAVIALVALGAAVAGIGIAMVAREVLVAAPAPATAAHVEAPPAAHAAPVAAPAPAPAPPAPTPPVPSPSPPPAAEPAPPAVVEAAKPRDEPKQVHIAKRKPPVKVRPTEAVKPPPPEPAPKPSPPPPPTKPANDDLPFAPTPR